MTEEHEGHAEEPGLVSVDRIPQPTWHVEVGQALAVLGLLPDEIDHVLEAMTTTMVRTIGEVSAQRKRSKVGAKQ